MKKHHDVKIRLSRTIVIVLTGCMLFIMASTITADPQYPPNEYTIPLQDQWNLITLPVNASIPMDQFTIRNNSIDYNFTEAVSHKIILGTIFGWDRQNQTYFMVSSSGLEPGKGYWMWAYYPCSLIIHSDVRGDGYITKLQSRWNIMGQTYDSSLALANLSVLYNGTSYSWENATSANNEEGHPLILVTIFKWDGTSQWYDFGTRLTPGEGYWTYAYYNCSLRQEIDAPVIMDNSADNAGTGNSYVCNASVVDSDGVNSVWLQYWYGSSSHSFVQMNPTGVNNYYEKILTIPSASVDSLHYIIAANDTKNYWDTTLEQTVIVNDDDAPVITNVLASPSSVSQGGYVNISSDVTDNIAVNAVRLHLTYPDLSTVNISMNKGSHYYLNQSYSMGGTYQFFIWANDTSNNSNKSSAHTFTINFTDTYTLTITKSGTGSGTVETNNTGPYYYGAKVMLWANASTGSSFSAWSGGLGGTDTPQSLTIIDDTAVDAQFTLNGPYTLTITKSGTGFGTVEVNNSGPYYYGAKVTLWANASTGSSFSAWSGGLGGSVSPESLTITADVSVDAVFILNGPYTLSITKSGTGSGTVEVNNSAPYYYGAKVTLWANASTGSSFSGWSGGLGGSVSPETLTITDDTEVDAAFTLNIYTISASAGSGGTIIPIGAVIVNYGGYKNFTITSDSGYDILDVLVDGDSVGAVGWYNFTNVVADHTISASFAQKEVTLTITVSGTGTGITECSPEGPYHFGDVVTLWANASTGSTFTGWSGALSGIITPQDLVMNGNKSVDAEFTLSGPFTLTISTSGSGTVEHHPSGPYYYGDLVTLWANASTGSFFEGWIGALSGTLSPEDLVMDADKSVTAVFSLNPYTITASAGTGGSINPSGAVVVNYGGFKNFTITSDSGYDILDVLVDGDSVGAVGWYNFTNVVADHTISASFAQKEVTLTITVSGTGTGITECSPEGPYHFGDVVTLWANASTGSTFTGWSGALSGTITPQDLVMNGNKSVDAEFTLSGPFTLTISTSGSGTVEHHPSGPYYYGDLVTLWANASTGSFFEGWIGALSGTLTPEDLVMDADKSVTAVFSLNPYTITASAGTGGSINPSGAVVVNYGGFKNFTITSDSGYDILDVLVDGDSVGAVSWYNFTNVIADHTISASFEQKEYTLTITVSGTGTGTTEYSLEGPYHYGDVVTLWAYPSTGSTFTGWSGALSGIITPQDLVMDADKSVNAEFSLNLYTITASAGTGGSINPSGVVSVAYGGYKNFTITPNTGYQIQNVLVDSLSVGTPTWYNFSSVIENHTINASFRETTPPAILLNFAGNPNDKGGPYYLPGTNTPAPEGYYTNASYQTEKWMQIKCTATDNVGIDKVWLHWRNGSQWTNNTYQLTHTTGNYYEINMSTNITPGPKYSFDLLAVDTSGNTMLYRWLKIGADTTAVDNRRYVQLGGTPTNISYTPYYFYPAQYKYTTGYGAGHNMTNDDVLHHDQGPDGTLTDSGYLLSTLPTSVIQERHCTMYIGYWFDETVTALPGTIRNIYNHFWWHTNNHNLTVAYGKTDAGFYRTESWGQSYPTNTAKAHSDISYNSITYYLESALMKIPSPQSFTDNDIYEFFVEYYTPLTTNITVINNRSIQSFVIFNIPDNTTLQGMDTDADGLTDYQELYVTFTNPFVQDTDNDGANDYVEYMSGSDPNDYKDIPTSYPVLSAESPQNQSIGQPLNPPLSITIYQAQNLLMNVTFMTNASGSWQTIGTNLSVSNGRYTQTPTTLNNYSTIYYWSVHCNAGTLWTNKTYHFTTRTPSVNNPPTLTNPIPTNGSTGIPITTTSLNITIQDPEGELINWTITTSPNIGSNSSTGATNGTKRCPISGLTYATTYYWTVSATDGHKWTNKTYTFSTWIGPRGWIYYKKITVNHSLVNQSLVNFPILVSIIDTNLVNHAQLDARDVQFWDATNVTRYHHEIEKYNHTTGEFIVWVNVTYLSATQDTIIWMRYGNNTCGSQENIAGTWDGNYLMVQHLNETGNTVYDSTTYGNNGVSSGTTFKSSGQIDGAREYDTDDYITVNNFGGYTNKLTAEAWIYRGATSIINVFSEGTNYNLGDWILYLRTTNMTAGIDFGINNHGSYYRAGSTPANTWFYLAATYNAGNVVLYVNSTQVGSKTIATTINNNYAALGLGNDNDGGQPWTPYSGKLDELRVSKTARNSSWVKTSFNTMSKPTSFIHISPEQERNYTLSVTTSGTGSGTIEYHPTGPYRYGAVVTLWANATVGSTFTGWSGALSGTISPQTLTMNADKSVNAQFTFNGPFTLTITNSGTGTGTIQTNISGLYPYGASVTLWANASTGSTFTTWSGALFGTTTPQSLVMDTNKTVNAQFTLNGPYTLTTSTSGTGLGSVNVRPIGPYYYGATVTLWANASIGSTFRGWSGALSGTITPQILVMDANKTVNALFILNPILSLESPQNQSEDQLLNPLLGITINQADNYMMNVTFMTNSTGSWQTIGSNLSVLNGRYSQTPTTMNSYNTTYYWSIHCNAGALWTNRTYHFTTWEGPRGWIYYKKITVNHSLVNQSLTNFPILIKTTDADLVNHAQPDARDVQFWDATNVTRYHHEIEKYNHTTGEFIVWVNVTYLSATQDTIIWMRYGNNTCGSQENIAGTWDGNYIMVQHLNETGSTLLDSTAYGQSGINTGTTFQSSCKIDGGRAYDDNDYITVNNFGGYTNKLTAEAWVYRDNTANINIFSEGTNFNLGDWILYLRTGYPTAGIDFGVNNHTDYYRAAGTTPVNTWFYLAATYNAGSVFIYVNTTRYGPGTISSSIKNNFAALGLGNDNDGGQPWASGKLDELRVSKTARNSSWIKTSYNTMSLPAAFIHIGSEEQITYSLTITMSGTGTGTVQYQPSGPYHVGSKVKLWANASTGSTFSGWSGALSGLITPQNLTMNGNKVVDAAFTLNGPYTLTITKSGAGSGTVVVNNSGPYYYGAKVKLWANASTGSSFSSWSGGLGGSVSPETLTITADVGVDAAFSLNGPYSLTVTKSGSGSGTVEVNNSGPYYYGAKVTLWANASTGSTFSGWSGGLGGSVTPESLTITADVGVDAAFTLSGPYTLTITTNGTGEGTVERNTTGPYYYGAQVKLWANASTGSTFTRWSGGLSGTVSPQTLTMDDTKAVNAQFTHLNQAPTHSTPLLVSEYGTNTTDEKLICTNQSTVDPEGNIVYNTYHWIKNGVSVPSLLLSFNTANTANAKDYSGYHNNGTVINGTTWISSGKIGGAYKFDGTNDYISIPDASSLDGDGTWNAMSMEFWVKSGKDAQKNSTILEKRGATSATQSYQIGFSSTSGGKLYCAYYLSTGYFTTTTNASTYVLNKDVWYHVVSTYKNGEGIKLFVNGSLYSYLATTPLTIRGSDTIPVNIGRRRTETTKFLNGSVDEVKIYPFALTQQQISQNYNNSKNGYSNASKIVKEQTSIGDVWRCEVTPSDGQLDGLTKTSNPLTIVPIYTLATTKSGTGSGTVEFNPSGPYYSGTVVTLWANASTGSTFTTWSGALSSTTTPETLTMDGNKTVDAQFTLNGPYSLTMTPTGTGSGTIQVNTSGPYYYGAKVKLWANVSVGSTFTGWDGALSGTTTPQDLIMDGDKSVSAEFTLNGPYALTIGTTGTGEGTVQTNNSGPYYYGAKVMVWANASSGSTFTGWNGALSGTNSPETLIMDDDKSVSAEFTLNSLYTITITKNGTGSGTVEMNITGPYIPGTGVKLWANASTGSTFTGWYGALTGTTTPQTLTMDSNKTVYAQFTLNGPYMLTITPNGTGTGTVETNISAPYYYGAKVKLWANASDGSTFTGWYGALSGTTTPENLIMDTDKTVYAEFTSTPFLSINSNFDSASIGSYTIDGTLINFTLKSEHLINSGADYEYWTNFKVQNTQNKNITFRITNANLVPFLSNTGHEVQMVYSYDGINWNRFTNHTYSSGTYKFWKNFTANQVQIATFFPFGYTEMQNYLETVNASQYAVKTVLGKSTQNRDIDLLTITNPGIANITKKIVYIIGRQHAAETASSHMLKGLIDFLISDNSDARRLRDSFVWYIVPMVNPDGVYLGNSRGNGTISPIDINREWDSSTSTEINIVKNHLTTTKNTIGVDFFIDWHSQIDDIGWYNYIYALPVTSNFYTQGEAFFTTLSRLTDFDMHNNLGFGSNSARGYAGNLGIFTFTFEPTPHLSTWTLDSLHQQGINVAFAIDEQYPLLLDSEFNDTVSSEDLRANATTRDWYESRNNDPLLVGLDTNNIVGNLGKKAGFYTQDIQHYTYLSQEFRSRQTGRFTVSLDILIDSISIYYDAVSKEAYNRTACLFIGSDDSDHTNGPCTTSNERFVFLTFFDNNPVENGSDIVLKARESSSQPWNKTVQWTTVMANLSYDTWYRLTLDVDVANRSYDVYVNDVLVGEDISGYNNYVSNSISHLTFYAGGTARGTYYVDNVFSPASERHSLQIAAQGNGSVSRTPGEATYRYGAAVQSTAAADIGWTFDHWAGDLSGSTNPKTFALTTDMNVTAVFTQNHYTLTTNTVGTGSITLTPPQSTFVYNESVMLQASGGSGWSFTHWTGNLSGQVNPATLRITHDTTITAHFSNTALYTLTANTVGSGRVERNPDRAVYEPGATVTLTPIGNRGWSFNNWTGNVPSGHTHDNPLSITMNASKLLTASFNSSEPTILTVSVLNITSTSATLKGNLNDTGGENCSVWFEWDNSNVEECMGTIATGTVCKDGRSILQKNRHYYYDNVKPYFYQGTNYSFFGIGDYGTTGYCRMGQNAKGLAIVNMDVSGTITHWKYQTDWSSGSQDNDAKKCLGNYSTVRDTAYYLARHGYYYGNGSTNGEYLIISSEPGVGAIVAIDRIGHTNITWINNTYAGCANSWYCDKKWDTGDYNDKRAKIIMNDIVQNGTSSDGDHLLNWQDIAQRVAKDTNGKEKGTGSYSYAGDIACGYSRSSVVSVAGNLSLNSSIHMSWLGIGQTTQMAIFLPLYAGNLHTASDIPSNFTTANAGKGIQPYADVKRNYARGNLADGNFYCSRVREILKYTSYNENLTFNAFNNLLDTIMYSANQQEARGRLDAFMETTLPKALRGYITNSTKSSTDTFKHYPQGVGYFSQAITGLKPGTTYYVKAWANNTGSDANGTILRFMTKPDAPSIVQATHYGGSHVNLSWTKGNGAFYTIIERNATGVSTWARGEGIQIYNGTGISCVDSGVFSTVQYYYRFWSYTTEKGLHQYSTNSATGYTGSNMPPVFTNINPTNGATGVLTNTTLLSVTIQDPEGNPISWTIQTSPNIGSNSGTAEGNGTKTCSISGLTYGTTYAWFVNATDGTTWNNKIYTFTTKVGILLDPDFDASIHSADLRNNSAGQDWYESRGAFPSGADPTLLTLDTSNIGGNTGKKAGLKNFGINSNAYLTQEFGAAQSNFFSVSFDIYIDRIENNSNFDRTGLVYIGDDSSTSNCPTGTSNERFVHMTFYDPTPGDTGNDIEIRARTLSTQTTATTSLWTQVATGLNYDTWYTIKLIVFPSIGKYNVYVDGVLKGFQINKYSGYAPSTVSFMSFSADSDGRGDFYVDNVVAVPFINSAPSITSELPVNSSSGVSISTSQLSVTIADSNNDLLNYTIQTSPNIGSSSGSGVTGGTKTCSILGLSYNTIYAWYVNVTDGNNWTRRYYTFTTEDLPGNNPPAISDPDPANESTGVPITTASLSVTIEDSEANPIDWTITTSPDVGGNSGTGESNGVKSCTLTGLIYGTSYTWYVKATDGNGWTNYSYIFTTELEPVNDPPILSGPIPVNNSVDVPVNTVLMNITIQDPEGDPIDWTIQTSPDIGSNSGTGDSNGSKTCSVLGLSYYTTYTWFVNATDGTSWMKETFTFTTKGLLSDPLFDTSVDSADLVANGAAQDWYESRNMDQTLLTLDTSDIGGNTGKKASLKGYSTGNSAYLTQEFSSAQTGTFTVSLDIYIDKIQDNSNYDRTGHIFIGNDANGIGGPCNTSIERFLCLAFYDSTPPGDTGNDLILVARNGSQAWATTSSWTQLATNLSYDTWYTIKLVVNFGSNNYDVYVDNVLKGWVNKGTEFVSSSLTHISFFVGGNSRGEFYVDNVYSPATS